MAYEQKQQICKEQLQVPYRLLKQIFNRSNLEKPDGRMLCLYRCTDEEYSESQEYLRQQSAQDSFSPVDSIIFCLYTSEWWRRNYVSGPWKWDEVFESIGLPFDFSRNRIPEMVTPGLRFFNRKILILNGHSRYFATLATEGGLPLKLLARERDAHLQRYLRTLLREFQVFGLGNASVIDLARRIGSQLPRSLQHSGLFQICGDLVNRIWQLQSKLGDTSTPIEDLDRMEPDWRNSFPLVVTDEVAEALLNSLVKEAVKIARIQEIKFVSILKQTSNGYQLERKIRIPSFFDARSLAVILGIDVQNLPYRTQLYLNQISGERDLLGLITRRSEGDDGRFAIEFPNQSPVILKDKAAVEPVWLDAKSGNLNSELRNIKGSLGLSDLPWVFSIKDDGTANQYELIGEGSLKTKFTEIFLALLPDSEIQQIGTDCSLVAVGSVLGRDIYRMSGTVVIYSNGNRSTIYAPGTDVVIDGQVFTSEGVTLNWHVPVGDYTTAPELQSFRNAWRCRGCGSSGTRATLPQACPVCGTVQANLLIRPYLQPAGFAVSIYEKPHNDLSFRNYIPVHKPWITAGQTPWASLPRPELGRYRFSHEGHIFYQSGGVTGHGYAICLRCGRSA